MKYVLMILMITGLALAATHQVNMVGFDFIPDTLSISQGDSVIWINASSFLHTSTSGSNGVPDGRWDSGLMAPNDSFSMQFNSAGSYPYYCTPHWTLGMVGLIDVQATGTEEKELRIEKNLIISSIHPNPTKGEITIKYAVVTPNRLRIEIYNSYGQLVKLMSDTFMDSGDFQSHWDGRDYQGRKVSPGIYFIRLESGNNKIEHKAVLVD